MSFFKNLFGKKDEIEDSLSILQTDEIDTVISDSSKPEFTNEETQTLTSHSKTQKNTQNKIRHNVFTKEEFALFMSLEIVDHNWEDLALNRQEAVDYLYNFISGYIPQVDDLEEDVVNFFYEFQIMIMVKKPVNDFYQLQEFSPFSTQAMRVFIELLKANNSGGKDYFLRRFDEIYPPNQQFIRLDEPIRFIEENSGLSLKEPIKIKIVGPNSGIKSLPRSSIGVQAEYCYLSFNYGFVKSDWDIVTQKSLSTIGKRFDCLTVSFPTDETRIFCFDITDFRDDYSYLRD